MNNFIDSLAGGEHLRPALFKGLFSGVLSAILWGLGGFDTALRSLIALTILDFLTGLLVGVAQRNLSSTIAIKGIAKKIGIYILIAVANITGNFLLNDILRDVVISFFIVSEGISIIENWGAFGLPIPQKLKNILAEVKDKEN